MSRRITLYRNGFQVDDGPLRSLEDPSSRAFLEDLRLGSVSPPLAAMLGHSSARMACTGARGSERPSTATSSPSLLFKVQSAVLSFSPLIRGVDSRRVPKELVDGGGSDVTVQLVDKMQEDYVPPAYVAYSGTGHSLGCGGRGATCSVVGCDLSHHRCFSLAVLFPRLSPFRSGQVRCSGEWSGGGWRQRCGRRRRAHGGRRQTDYHRCRAPPHWETHPRYAQSHAHRQAPCRRHPQVLPCL